MPLGGSRPLPWGHDIAKLEPRGEVVLLDEPGVDDLPFLAGIIEFDLYLKPMSVVFLLLNNIHHSGLSCIIERRE